jgi:DHA1 family inner membrane transport protein
MNLALVSLAVAAFGVGTTEFVVMGLLPGIATDLSVSVPAAGGIVTAYAAGVVVGAPIMAMATNRMPRKAALLALMLLFTLGNVLCFFAPTYELVIGARIVTAFAHGAFFGIAAIAAADLVPDSRRTQAIALVFAGLTVANVLGVPGGTWLGAVLGWRATFLAVAAIGVLGMAMLALFLPLGMTSPRARLGDEFKVLARPAVLSAMALTVATSASFFMGFTFVIPYLTEVKGLSMATANLGLVFFGLGMTGGGLAGGHLADWNLTASIRIGCAAVVAVFLVMPFVWPSPAVVMVAMFVWGMAVFALAPPLQMLVIRAAKDAPTAASTINQAAFNLGNAIGAWLASVGLAAGLSYASLPLAAAGLAFCALLLATVVFVKRSPRGAAAPA